MTIGYELCGEGPEPVVVLHDWQGDHRNYDLVRPFLDRGAFRYAFADLRGYGRSRELAGEYSAREAAGDVLALAAGLGWERFHLVGHSMTGMVVQRLAIDAPARVKSVVAANPVPACGLQMPAADRGFFAATVTDDGAFAQLLAAISHPDLSPAWTAYKLEICRSSADAGTRMQYLEMFDRTDFAAEAQGLETPMLVLLGEHDHESLSEANMRGTFGKYYPKAEILVCRAAGHYPMQERPPYFAAVIERFMARHR